MDDQDLLAPDDIPELPSGGAPPLHDTPPARSGPPLAAGLLVLLLLITMGLAGYVLFTDRWAAQHTELTATAEAGTPNAAAPVGTPTIVWPAGSTPLFQIPINPALLHGFAVADDGSFWIARQDAALLHYSPTGTLLGTLTLPTPIAGISALKMQFNEFWILDQSRPAPTVFRVAADGHLVDQYPMSELMAQGLLDIQLGGQHEVDIQRDRGTPVAMLVSPDGTLLPMTSFGIEGRYMMYPHDGTGTVYIDGGATTPVPVTHPLADLQMFQINGNGDRSFYVVAEELIPGPGGAYLYPTIYHYASDGRLLGQARIPLTMPYKIVSRRSALGPDGALYVLMDTVGGTEMLRVPFSDPATPLPDYGPPSSGVLPASGQPTPTPVWDLPTLIHNADVIAEFQAGAAKDTDLPGVGRWSLQDLDERSWLKPEQSRAAHISLMSNPGPTFAYSQMDLRLTPGQLYFLFLTVLDRRAGIYTVTGGPAGAFGVGDDFKIHNTGIDVLGPYPPPPTGLSAYEGWPLGQFMNAIILALTPGPTPSTMEATAIAPTAPAISPTESQVSSVLPSTLPPTAIPASPTARPSATPPASLSATPPPTSTAVPSSPTALPSSATPTATRVAPSATPAQPSAIPTDTPTPTPTPPPPHTGPADESPAGAGAAYRHPGACHHYTPAADESPAYSDQPHDDGDADGDRHPGAADESLTGCGQALGDGDRHRANQTTTRAARPGDSHANRHAHAAAVALAPAVRRSGRSRLGGAGGD